MTERHVLETFLVAGVATIGSYLTIYWYEKYRSKRIPKKWVQVGFVSKICIYPVKSGHKMEIQRAKFTPLGLQKVTDNDDDEPILRDRCIVILRDGSVFFQGRCKIVQIKTTVINKKCIAIDAPGMETLKIQLPPEKDAPLYDIEQKDFPHTTLVRRSARSLGREVDHWFSKYLLGKDSGIKCGYSDGTPENYLIYFCRHAMIFFMNLIRYKTMNTVVQHTDLLLLNQSSIEDIQSRIETLDPENPITVDRFRGNILVAGPGIRPYDEDAWKWIKIGDKMVTRKVEDCLRCAFTTLNPDTGGRNKRFEPINTLNKYRTRVSEALGTSPAVGILLEIMRNEGVIAVGDPVFISNDDRVLVHKIKLRTIILW